MAFSPEIYGEAFEQKKRERHNALLIFEKEKEELLTANPRLEELERKTRQTAARIGMAAIAGSDALARLRAELESIEKEKTAITAGLTLPAPRYSCGRCEDTGYVDGKRCDCVEHIAKRLTYERLCAEMPLSECRFDNFDLSFYPEKTDSGASPRKRMTQVLKRCREFCDGGLSGESLLLFGGVGLGKTHLSLAIANEVLAHGHSVIYGSAQDLLQKLHAEHFSRTGGTAVSDGLLGCDLLIIDDLGTEVITSISQSFVYNIINTRLLRHKSTVISTNLSFEGIEKNYTARVTSRINGAYTLLQCQGFDIRQQKKLMDINRKKQG